MWKPPSTAGRVMEKRARRYITANATRRRNNKRQYIHRQETVTVLPFGKKNKTTSWAAPPT